MTLLAWRALDQRWSGIVFSDRHDAARGAIQSKVSSRYAAMPCTYCTIWERFCTQIDMDTLLQGFQGPIPFLQIFLHQICARELAEHRKPDGKWQVKAYVCVVGHALSQMGILTLNMDSTVRPISTCTSNYGHTSVWIHFQGASNQ